MCQKRAMVKRCETMEFDDGIYIYIWLVVEPIPLKNMKINGVGIIPYCGK